MRGRKSQLGLQQLRMMPSPRPMSASDGADIEPMPHSSLAETSVMSDEDSDADVDRR